MNKMPEQIFLLDPSASEADLSRITNGIQFQSAQGTTSSQNVLSICRICASKTELVLPIFEKEGLENNLAEKIEKYLPIQVSQEDRLPTVVCYQCVTTIISWHELVTTCLQTDTLLRSQLNGTSTVSHCVNQPDAGNGCESKDASNTFLESVKKIILSFFDDIQIEDDCGIEFICIMCNNTQFVYIQDLTEHLQTDHNLDSTCTEATVETFIKNHIRLKESPETDNQSNTFPKPKVNQSVYKCSQCEKRFTSASRLINHLNNHAIVDFESGVTCCEHVYSERESLVQHVRRDHVQRQHAPATCRSCGHVAGGAADLRAHVLSEHVAARTRSRPLADHNLKKIPAACPRCGRTFSNKYNMAQHLRSHFGAESFPCPHCGRRYSSRGNLAAHVRGSHGGAERPCAHCGEAFARAGDLRRHEAAHAPPRLQCAACPAAFTSADSLRRHRAAHADRRPHACPRCPRRFRRASHRAAHLARNACRLLQP